MYSCTLKAWLGLYAASKLDKHEQWVESAGTCQKASQIKKSHFTNQAITEL